MKDDKCELVFRERFGFESRNKTVVTCVPAFNTGPFHTSSALHRKFTKSALSRRGVSGREMATVLPAPPVGAGLARPVRKALRTTVGSWLPTPPTPPHGGRGTHGYPCLANLKV